MLLTPTLFQSWPLSRRKALNSLALARLTSALSAVLEPASLMDYHAPSLLDTIYPKAYDETRWNPKIVYTELASQRAADCCM